MTEDEACVLPAAATVLRALGNEREIG